MKKEILAASLSAVMLLQLAACGQKENDEQSTPPVQTVVSDTAETVDTADSSVKDSDISSSTDTEEDEEDSKPLSEPLSMVVSSNAPKSSSANNNSSKASSSSKSTSSKSTSAVDKSVSKPADKNEGATTTQIVQEVPANNNYTENYTENKNPPAVNSYPELVVSNNSIENKEENPTVVPEPEPEPVVSEEPIVSEVEEGLADPNDPYASDDMNVVRDAMIAYGIELGMNLDESLTIDDTSWAPPEDTHYYNRNTEKGANNFRRVCEDSVKGVADRAYWEPGNSPNDIYFNVVILPSPDWDNSYEVYVVYC